MRRYVAGLNAGRAWGGPVAFNVDRSDELVRLAEGEMDEGSLIASATLNVVYKNVVYNDASSI